MSSTTVDQSKERAFCYPPLFMALGIPIGVIAGVMSHAIGYGLIIGAAGGWLLGWIPALLMGGGKSAH